jgi:hypothetical protein
MMRTPILRTLALGLAVALCPNIANAAPRGGFPAGARLYGFHGPSPTQRSANTETAKAPPPLPGPLNYLDTLAQTPGHPLEYPFLASPRCADQSIARLPCKLSVGTAADTGAPGPDYDVR